MTRRGFAIRLVAAILLGLAAAAFAIWLGLWANFSQRPIDHGVASALALVSTDAVDGMTGNLTVSALDPAVNAEGRIYVFIEGGLNEPETDEPADGPVYTTDDVQVRYSAVFGGALGDGLGTCDDDVDVVRGLAFGDLTEAQRNGVILNLREQQENRAVVYGDPGSHTNLLLSPAETASSMTYTVLRFTTLWPERFTIDSTTSKTDSTPGSATEETSYIGFYATASCGYDQAHSFTEQAWGRRWELPPVTSVTVTPDDGVNHHVASVRRVFRKRQTPGFGFYSSQPGYTSLTGEVIENSNGLSGLSQTTDNWGDPGERFVTASVEQASFGFQAASYNTNHDLALFVAGSAVGVVTSMTVAALKLIVGSSRIEASRPQDEGRVEPKNRKSKTGT